MSGTQFLTTEHMFKNIDNKGQGSAELILIIGGLIVIVLFVGSYLSNITQKTQNSLHQSLKTEREYILEKI
ncbi:class III signal peptide-containing protein [Methanobrevibacter sp.]|uniref:class III signal peptide-containing protein n=1 Tax=Methanobrevibacter sp. TaxID=66852 RepID=UPI00388D82FD